jgi:hypothetical protein
LSTFLKKIRDVACNILLKKISAVFAKSIFKKIQFVAQRPFEKNSLVDTLLAIFKKFKSVTQISEYQLKKIFMREVHALEKKSWMFTGERDTLKKASFVAATSGGYDNLLVTCPRCYYFSQS